MVDNQVYINPVLKIHVRFCNNLYGFDTVYKIFWLAQEFLKNVQKQGVSVLFYYQQLKC